MSDSRPPGTQFVRLYVTTAFPCSYLPNRFARSQVVEPSLNITSDNYGDMVRNGFRRSGLFTYRPRCDNCSACIPVRIPVRRFASSRNQRRCLKRHAYLHSNTLPLHFNPEHYQLYIRYQQTRHRGGSMDQDDEERYKEYLLRSRVDTRLIEFRTPEAELVMVSIIDYLDDGLSAVYTFFDPDRPGHSFGTYGILWQIALCKRLGLDYLYLGYWIEAVRSMRYKSNFQPLEQRIDGQWKTMTS
ncbi:MAG: arginyltransferase [Lautropia sp.]|nr:arginyltransferase [Lautropia sp.]